MTLSPPLTVGEREALTSSPQKQDEAHRRGAYSYLDSLHMCPRFGVIAAYIRQLNIRRILDVGCGTGQLRQYLGEGFDYVGIDVSETAIRSAEKAFANIANTQFAVLDLRSVLNVGQFDCVVWAGIGKGCGTDAAAYLQGWNDAIELFQRCLYPNGYLILEHIVPYTDDVDTLLGGWQLISETRVDCVSSTDHPERVVRILTSSEVKDYGRT